MSQGCVQRRGDLAAYVIGALDREEGIAVRQHLAGCRPCRAVYEDLLPVREWLGQVKLHLATCPACRAEFAELLPASGQEPVSEQ